jgi:hypothetical protein
MFIPYFQIIKALDFDIAKFIVEYYSLGVSGTRRASDVFHFSGK